MKSVAEKIKEMKLTKADAVIAEYILENLDTIGILTSSTLAEKIGVSDTSVIRFIRKLGYRGYSDFRSEMNARMAAQYNKEQSLLMPGEKYTQTKSRLKQDSLIRDVGGYILDNLEKSFAKLDGKVIEEVADIILKSNSKYIAGFRGTASCAYYLANRLVMLVPRVITISHADASAVETIMDITEQDCLVVFSFARYSEINKSVIDIAKKNGARVILITDRQTSRFAARADIVIITKVDGLGFANSYVAPFGVSEVILLAVSGRGKEECDERIHLLDAVINEEKLY